MEHVVQGSESNGSLIMSAKALVLKDTCCLLDNRAEIAWELMCIQDGSACTRSSKIL